MRVTHFQRKPNAEQYSVERYFASVRSAIGDQVEIVQVTMPFASRGLLRRIGNLLYASWKQIGVNHVTGDVNYVSLFMRRDRTVLTVLDCEVLSRLSGWRRSVVKWLWFALPARRAAWITVISEETKRSLLEHVSVHPDRVVVIPVSVNLEFEPDPQPFNSDCPRILQIGTKANKNVPRLLEALCGLRCELDLVGPMTREIQAALERFEIHYNHTARLSDDQIVQKYRDCDIVAFVSTHEGFGMPIVEAQCVERPVVTSDRSSMPEVAGKGACLVNPFDVSDIRRGFDRVIADSQYRERLVDGGRKNCQRFTAGQIADEFSKIYARLTTE